MAETHLEKLNQIAVSGEELWEVAGAVGDLDEDRRDFYGFLGQVCSRYASEDPMKALAVVYRMQALARFLGHHNAKGWAMPPLPDGAIVVNYALFAAAASVTVIEEDGHPAFEPDGFLRKALELSEEEGAS